MIIQLIQTQMCPLVQVCLSMKYFQETIIGKKSSLQHGIHLMRLKDSICKHWILFDGTRQNN